LDIPDAIVEAGTYSNNLVDSGEERKGESNAVEFHRLLILLLGLMY
jgi:hypothetical protein